MNRRRRKGGSNFLRVFGMPIILAAISVFGLISALLGDGVWDVLSWIALWITVAVIVRHVWFADPGKGASAGRGKGGDKTT